MAQYINQKPCALSNHIRKAKVLFLFSDLSKTKVEASDLSLLQSDNVWCLKPDYIAEYLMQDPPPPPQKYLLPEIAKLAEPDGPVSSQSRKRKGEDDISGGDKRARVWETELTEDVCLSRSENKKDNSIFWPIKSANWLGV